MNLRLDNRREGTLLDASYRTATNFGRFYFGALAFVNERFDFNLIAQRSDVEMVADLDIWVNRGGITPPAEILYPLGAVASMALGSIVGAIRYLAHSTLPKKIK